MTRKSAASPARSATAMSRVRPANLARAFVPVSGCRVSATGAASRDTTIIMSAPMRFR